MKERILIVDDDSSFIEVMHFLLKEEGYEVETAFDGKEGFEKFLSSYPQVVITDIKMPKLDGISLLKKIKKYSVDSIVIMITAFGDIQTAVSAMKEGAYDFITKPLNREHLKIIVQKAFEHIALKEKVKKLSACIDSSKKEIVFLSPVMQKVISLADKVSESNATVLIIGESGTGKELLARRIHNKSERKDFPFVVVNCAAIPKELIESELFGHVKGSFTGAVKDYKGKFETANKGTIFLDEVAELSLLLQAKILRVLQENMVDVIGKETPIPVDVRVIAATNRELEEEVKNGNFRIDLFYRLNVFPIKIPPLRERKEDIPILFEFFLKRYGKEKEYIISPSLMKKLENYRWP